MMAQGRLLVVEEEEKEAESTEVFGAELEGEIVEIKYPQGTCKVRVTRYLPKKGWHRVSSAGLSTWDGQNFNDEINITEMYAAGLVDIVSRRRGRATTPPASAAPNPAPTVLR